jgi:hypothetical protein
VQIQSSASVLSSKSKRDLRKAHWGSSSLRLSKLFPNLVPLLCRWYAAFRSFRGHIRIQSATSAGRVHLGPSVQFRDGCYQANTRTLARAEGIEKLQATHQWVDIGDLHIFLMGFEAGEEYSKTDCPHQDSSSSRNVHARIGL